ncbi:MAG TPA: GC-type dockerin domain-anchored protein [Phycisphaerales bacterium]|nr:GC-type dockerin domain-anchored protein [Phycisphaerales bacterium]
MTPIARALAHAAALSLAAAVHAQLVVCGSSARVGGPGAGPTPDYDQRRDALPSDGSMYCSPTSFANLMGYYALRGYPQLFPNASFAGWVNYDAITTDIAAIGSLMGTSASGGTGDLGSFNGGLAWMDARGGPPMNWSQLLGSNVTPQAMFRVLETGGTAAIAYGRYQQFATNGSWRWTGGHVVTLDRVDRLCPGPAAIFPWRVHYRDPATNEDPNDLDAQSAYATSVRPSRMVDIFYDLGDGTYETRPSFEFLVAGDPGTRRVWYTMNSLTPENVLYRPFVLGTVWRFDPSIVFTGGPQQLQFDPGPTEDVAFGGEPGVAMVLRSQANGGLTPVRLAAWDAVHDQMLAQVPLTGAAALMCVGRLGQVHVYNAGAVRTFRLNQGDAPSFTELGTPRAIVSAVGSIVAMGFDDRFDMVLLLRSDGAVVRIGVDRTGAASGPLTTLGNLGNPTIAGSGRPRIAPGTGSEEDYWIGPCTPATIGGPDTLRRFRRDGLGLTVSQVESLSPPLPPVGGAGTWTHGTAISDWAAADRGRMVLLRGTQLQEVRRGVGGWLNQNSSPWFARTARGSAAVSRSRNQMDRTAPAPAVWNLLNPDTVPETPDCPADVGRTGGVPGPDGLLNNNDFVVFIDWFFTHDARADRGTTGGVEGHDGQFNNNDFVVFIDQFFAGC